MVAVEHIYVLPQRGQLRGDIRERCIFSLQMLQRYCKPWQASCFLHRANELCKRTGENWTGEKIIGTTGQKHIAKMPGCRVSRHPGISSQITGQAAFVQYSVRFPLPQVDPVNLPNSIHWMILNARRVSRNATPFRDWTRFRTTDHHAEYFSYYPYYRTHLFDECV